MADKTGMLEIAVITSGVLPVPAVRGGAVENLTDYYLDYNDRHQRHHITVYSAWHPLVKRQKALSSQVNRYVYIDTHSFWFRLRAKLYGKMHADCYYFYQLEYFFECVMRKLLRRHYDLIILENRPGVAIKLARRCRVPVVSHIHTNLVNPQTERKEDILAATRKFVTVSDYIRHEIERTGRNTCVETVYNGLDVTRFKRGNVVPLERGRFGFSDSDFVAIFTGRIVPKKGVKELMQAFQLLKDQPDVKLIVVGGDNFGDSVERNVFLDELHRMEHEMQGKVVMTGYVPYAQLPAYLAMADVAIVPSRINEALGMTCIEAVAMGLPVIATDDGGIAETLKGQKHVLLNPNGDLPHDIAQAVMKVKCSKDEFQGNSLPHHFTKEAYAEAFFKAVLKVLTEE